MSSLEDEEQTIHVSKRQLSELETRANAATDFIQHFQNIDKELKKEKAKVKKFTKMLIDGHKVIERLTSVRCASAGDLSSVDSKSLMQSLVAPSIEIDGSSGSSICFPFGDETPSPEPFPCSDKKLTPISPKTIGGGYGSRATVTVSRSDSNSSTSLGNVSLPYKRSASINISIGNGKSNNVFSDVVDEKGVSESVFLNLVRELKRTKYCLNQLMLEKGLTLEEFMKGKVDKATLEDMAANIEDLKKENENYQNKISELNNSLSFYKKLVKEEREGLTFQSDSKSIGTKSKSLDALKSEEELDVLKIQNSQLKNQLMTMEEEKNMILDNYAKCIQAINELEHNLNEDQLKKQSDLLKREVEKLQREIKNLQNDNEKLVSSVSHHAQFREKWKEEHAKLVKAEAELKEDKTKQQRMEAEINLLKAKVKHLYKQIDPEKSKSQKPDKIQAPVKPTKKQSLPVESTSTFVGSEHLAHTSLTGVKAKSVDHVKNIMSSYECERCQAQFEDEMEHLRHINKCLD